MTDHEPTSDLGLDVRHAVLLLGGALLTLFFCIHLFGAGLLGLVMGQVLGLGLPSLAMLVRAGAGRGFGVPPPLTFVGAALVGATFWVILATTLVPCIEFLFRPGEEQALSDLFGQSGPLWVELLAVAILPALCEELLFRGVLYGALRRRLKSWQAIALSALVFGLFHLSPARAITMFGLGLVLGMARDRSGSIWPCMLIHALNNAAALLLLRVTASNQGIPLAAGLVAYGSSAVGLWLLARSPTFKSVV